jgi:uncharacterized protein YjiS (DUF1127 family)
MRASRAASRSTRPGDRWWRLPPARARLLYRARGRLTPAQIAGIFTIRPPSFPKSLRVIRQTTGSGKMIDPIGKTFHRLGMQLPGCSLIPSDDHRVVATGSGQIEPAVAAVPSLTGTQAHSSLREAGAGLVRRLFDVARNLWMRVRECRMPLELDDHVLRDIGLTRVEYRFLPMSRATTPQSISKQQKSSRSAAVFVLRFKRNRIPQT